jgi:hypothetical protein
MTCRHPNKGIASRISEFFSPYAGITRIRFKSMISAPHGAPLFELTMQS